MENDVFFFFPTSFLPLQISFCFFLTLLLFRLQSVATPHFFHNNFIEIKFTHHAIPSFKVHNLMTIHGVVHPPSQSIVGHIITLKESLQPPAITSQHPHHPASLWQPWIYFLFPPIGLSWTLHINGIEQHVVLCDWLLPLSITVSRYRASLFISLLLVISFLYM